MSNSTEFHDTHFKQLNILLFYFLLNWKARNDKFMLQNGDFYNFIEKITDDRTLLIKQGKKGQFY